MIGVILGTMIVVGVTQGKLWLLKSVIRLSAGGGGMRFGGKGVKHQKMLV